MPAKKGTPQTGKYAGQNGNGCWSTKAELMFIDRLGEHAKPPVERVKLLRGYISGLRRRREWGTLDRYEVLNHAMIALEQAEAMR